MSESEQNIISFSLARFWQGCQSCSQCVHKEYIARKNCMKKSFFPIKFFAEFEHKVLGLFPTEIPGSFPKKSSSCPDDQTWKSLESRSQEKARKLNFFRKFIDKSRTFGGNFPAVLPKLHSTCRVTFSWKATFASKILIGKIFWTLGANSQSFGEIAFAQLYKLPPTSLNEKQLWVPIFEQKKLFLKVFVILHGLTDSEQNLISSFFKEFFAGLSKLHSRCPDEIFVKNSHLGKKLWK